MIQAGFAVKYTSGPHAEKFWGRDEDGWIVSTIPWIFGQKDIAEKAQSSKEHDYQKVIVPVWLD